MWEYNYTDELMHFGVKGMKWGVRRYQNKDGTLTPKGKSKYGSDISRRKVKQVKKQIQAGFESKSINLDKLNSKVIKEAEKTKEYKSAKEANDFIEEVMKGADAQGISRNRVVFNRETAMWVNGVNAAYDNKLKEIATKHVDEYASITLKSLGYEDTKSGREWLKEQNFMDW